MRLFTCDVETSLLQLDEHQTQKTNEEIRRIRVRQRLARDRLKQSIVSGEIQVSELFETDPDLIEMRTKINKSFLI